MTNLAVEDAKMAIEIAIESAVTLPFHASHISFPVYLSVLGLNLFSFLDLPKKEVLRERLLFARNHRRSCDELTPHPATQHERKRQAWTLVIDQIQPQSGYGIFG